MLETDRYDITFGQRWLVRLHEEPPRPPAQTCTCKGPMYICIPAGAHIHITCPLHGDVVLRGPEIRW